MNNLSESYLSLKILKEPEKDSKGALILSQVDFVVKELPWIKDKFYLIERRGWRGLNESKYAHIKLIEDLSLWTKTLETFPEAICLDIGPADFVDTDSFKPLSINKDYEGIQVSHWSEFKRPELFTRAAGLLPNKRFLKLGHFIKGGSDEELQILNRNIKLAEKLGAKIDLPYAKEVNNSNLPNSKEVMNRYINRARIGILTSAVEGINRFKMECLSAGVPVLVPTDTSYPTKKHINAKTGGFFEPTPEGLTKKIKEMLEQLETYQPRNYIEKTTGKPIALQKLKSALEEVCKRDRQDYIFDNIDWDGRNQSLIWGWKVFENLKRYKS